MKFFNSRKITIEMLDSLYGEVKIGPLNYSAGKIVEKLDPIVFERIELDYLDDLWRDGIVEKTPEGFFSLPENKRKKDS